MDRLSIQGGTLSFDKIEAGCSTYGGVASYSGATILDGGTFRVASAVATALPVAGARAMARRVGQRECHSVRQQRLVPFWTRAAMGGT